ncbi:MAG: RNA 2',3'-cyclic phosphodiesterase [Syntrophomonadaceae bacterium]
MRLFIAIPVTDAVKDYAALVRNEMDMNHPDVKWVEKTNYHLTLKFLGEVDPASLGEIKKRLKTVAEACPVFNISTRGLGFFPSRGRPRVIWVGVYGEMDKADFLGERVDAYLTELGFDPEKKRSFHLTLGRIRSDLGLAELQLKAAGVNKRGEEHSFTVDQFLLMESKLSSRGPHYSVVESYRLEG